MSSLNSGANLVAGVREDYLASMTENLPENIQDLISDFEFLDNWEERYMHVIDMGKSMSPLEPALKTEATKVKGCVSQVWLVSEKQGEEDPILVFRGDSDAHIVKGLVAVVLEIFSGRRASYIATLDAQSIMAKLGLSEHLSPQRSNGLQAMIARIKAEAENLTTQ
jgi:cysteine desulfuration protein SufE